MTERSEPEKHLRLIEWFGVDERLATTLTRVAGLVGVVTTALYVAGFCATALFFEARGISAHSISRPIYLLTGAWFLAPLVCAWFIREAWSLPAGPQRPAGKAIVLMFLIFLPVCIIVLLSSSGHDAAAGSGRANLVETGGMVGGFMLLVASGVFILGVIDGSTRFGQPGRAVAVLMLMVFGVMYFGLFSTTVMAKLSPQLGGGAARFVRFVLPVTANSASELLQREENCWVNIEGVDAAKVRLLSRPYALAFESGDTYFVSLGGGGHVRTIALPKSAFSGVIYAHSVNSPARHDTEIDPSVCAPLPAAAG